MITFIAFVLTILGCINWLLIGMLQYDFIAGLFGFQASMFSRIIYIAFGVSACYLVLRVIINKGSFKVWEKKKAARRSLEQTNQSQQPQPAQMQPACANVEAAQEQIPQNNTQSAENQQEKPKKKKWWQFWKRNPKKKKTKSIKEEQTHQQSNVPPIDIDVSLNAMPEHFNEQPSIQQQPAQDNLFDEL